jgi:hypothetical protein
MLPLLILRDLVHSAMGVSVHRLPSLQLDARKDFVIEGRMTLDGGGNPPKIRLNGNWGDYRAAFHAACALWEVAFWQRHEPQLPANCCRSPKSSLELPNSACQSLYTRSSPVSLVTWAERRLEFLEAEQRAQLA